MKKYNNKQWTQARFNSFVKGALRAASQRWPPKYSVLSKAFTTRKENKATGRLAKHFRCSKCKEEFPQKEVEVNHIVPVVPLSGFDSWDKVIERLFCEEDGLEVVCRVCHKEITKEEGIKRRAEKD